MWNQKPTWRSLVCELSIFYKYLHYMGQDHGNGKKDPLNILWIFDNLDTLCNISTNNTFKTISQTSLYLTVYKTNKKGSSSNNCYSISLDHLKCTKIDTAVIITVFTPSQKHTFNIEIHRDSHHIWTTFKEIRILSQIWSFS